MTITRNSEDIGRLGKAIYDRDIRAQVEAGHHGEYVVIDVDHGCWSVAADLLEARDLLDQQRPDPESRNVYCLRVGYKYMTHFGGRPLTDRT